MGKKYLLEIEENKDGSFAWSNFAPYTEPDLEQVRKEGYQKGYETGYEDGYDEPGKNQQEAYQRGLADAWEAAKRIGSDSRYGLEKMGFDFSRCDVADYNPSWFVVKNCSASECIEKIRKYEQRQEEIQVGDEVFYGNTKGIVIRPEDSDRYASVFTAFGEHISAENKDLTKTGRHFPEIATVLEKMREESNG